LVSFRVNARGLENVVVVGEQGAGLADGKGARRLLRERGPFCCTWLLDPNLSWEMLRSKTKLRLPA
jgi:hypothetical protein